MKFNVEKLKQLSRPMTDEEKRDIDFRRENREWLAISERLALKLRRILRTEGISQNELATRMEVSPAQITKILSGKENLGLKTICKIEHAIGQPLIEVPDDDSNRCIEYTGHAVTPSPSAGRYVASSSIVPTTHKRSGIYSSIIARNLFA